MNNIILQGLTTQQFGKFVRDKANVFLKLNKKVTWEQYFMHLLASNMTLKRKVKELEREVENGKNNN